MAAFAASDLFVEGKNATLGNGTHSNVDWDTDAIDAVIIDDTDAAPDTTDQDRADILAGIVATSADLTITVSGGAVDATDFTFTAVSGDACDSMVILKDSGVDATSPLLICYDDSDTSGLPVTPNGGDIDVTVNASGLFSI